ncbi:hypothetical protein [Methanocella conradii]|uniref:hypothetical protein n=1 Tax=Methanocella conradii TaxID=1175444 RepID=UPI00064E457B|nr:hypothetical protein [Methanocella conradii]
MLKAYPHPAIGRKRKPCYFKNWYELSEESRELLASDPNALLFAAVLDQSIPWEQAMEAPYELKKGWAI